MDERDEIFFNCCTLDVSLTFFDNGALVLVQNGVLCSDALERVCAYSLDGGWAFFVVEVVIVSEIGVCIVIYVDFYACSGGGPRG